MDELDTLFNLDSSLDTLDKTIHEKYVLPTLSQIAPADRRSGSKPSTHKHRSSRLCRGGYERPRRDCTRQLATHRPERTQPSSLAKTQLQQTAPWRQGTHRQWTSRVCCSLYTHTHVRHANSRRTTTLSPLARQRQGLDDQRPLVRHAPDSCSSKHYRAWPGTISF